MQKKKVAAILVATALLFNIARPTINATEPTVKITNLKYKYNVQKSVPVYIDNDRIYQHVRNDNITITFKSQDPINESSLQRIVNERDMVKVLNKDGSFKMYTNRVQDHYIAGENQQKIQKNEYLVKQDFFYKITRENTFRYYNNDLESGARFQNQQLLTLITALNNGIEENNPVFIYDSLPFNFELEVPTSLQNQISYEFGVKSMHSGDAHTESASYCIRYRHPKDYIIKPINGEAFTTESITDSVTLICTRGYYSWFRYQSYYGSTTIDGIKIPNSFNEPVQLKLITLEEYKKQSDVQTRVLQKQIEDLQRQTQEALTAKIALAAENAKIEQRKQLLEQEYQRLKGEVTAQRQILQQERDALTSEKAKLEQQKTEFANKQQQWQTTYDAQKEEAQQKSQQAQQKELDASAKVAEAEEKLRNAKLTDANNTQKLLELGSQLEKAKQDQEKARAEYLSYNEKLSKLNKEYEKIRADREVTEHALNEANSKLADVTSRQQALITKEQTIAQKEKEVANLQEEKKQNDLRAKQLEEQLKNNNLSIEYITKLKAQIEKQKQALPWEEIGLVENTDSYNKDTFRTNKLPVKPIIKKKATTELEKGNVVMVDLSNGLTIKKVEGLEEVQSFYDATASDKIKLYKITEDTQLIEFTHIIKASKIGKGTHRIPATKLNPAKKSIPMTALTPATPITPPEKPKVTQPLTKLTPANPIVPVEVKPQVQPKTPEVNAPSGGGRGGSSSSSTPTTVRELSLIHI